MAPTFAPTAAIAAHRFGLGEAALDAMARDPAGWLAAQIGPADAAVGTGLLSTAEALGFINAERAARLAERARPAVEPGAASSAAATPPATATAAVPAAAALAAAAAGGAYRQVLAADARSRLQTAALSDRPFAERLVWFWSNHFTVSSAKAGVRGLVGAFERDAIRPNIAGSFEQLLRAAVTHPAMLRYLDNVQSAGPGSPVVARAARRAARSDEPARLTGLNENLGRELLELHTLGAASARGPAPVYTQADVTALARVLTGWRVSYQDTDPLHNFDPAWHEPGPKTVLGKAYPSGPEALDMVLHDLALHPATARHLATKLARHVVADEPPPALVERLALTYLRNGAQLAPVYRALIDSPEAWQAAPAKLKSPEEFVVSSMRLLGLGRGPAADRTVGALAAGITAMGQRPQAAPSPAGHGDRAEDWLGPDAIWKRIEWSTRLAERLGATVDARELAARSLGPWLSADTRTQIARAADGPQALALLLMAPEFQRR